MPQKYFDAAGAEVELLTPEEAKALQDKATKLETDFKDVPTKLSAYETSLKEKDAELEKFRNKDMNFKKLRDMTEVEKAQYSAKELEYKKQIEETNEKFESYVKSQKDSSFSKNLNFLAGGDKDLSDKIKFHYDRFEKKSGSDEEMSQLLSDAFALATKGTVKNPLNDVTSYVPGAMPTKQEKGKKFHETEEGKGIAHKLGIK